MATFQAAIPVLMGHEGGVADVGDGEGITAFGWTLATCRKLGVKPPTTQAEAEALFETYFWSPFYGKLNSQIIATKVFDDAVNQGPGVSVKTLQQALCAVGSIVTVDGTIGSATVAAANAVPDNLLLPWFRLHQYITYDLYINANPAQREKFRDGLAKRAAWPDPDGSIAASLLNCTYRPINTTPRLPGDPNAATPPKP